MSFVHLFLNFLDTVRNTIDICLHYSTMNTRIINVQRILLMSFEQMHEKIN